MKSVPVAGFSGSMQASCSVVPFYCEQFLGSDFLQPAVVIAPDIVLWTTLSPRSLGEIPQHPRVYQNQMTRPKTLPEALPRVTIVDD